MMVSNLLKKFLSFALSTVILGSVGIPAVAVDNSSSDPVCESSS